MGAPGTTCRVEVLPNGDAGRKRSVELVRVAPGGNSIGSEQRRLEQQEGIRRKPWAQAGGAGDGDGSRERPLPEPPELPEPAAAAHSAVGASRAHELGSAVGAGGGDGAGATRPGSRGVGTVAQEVSTLSIASCRHGPNVGIGLTLKRKSSGELVVSRVKAGGPAAREGSIQPGDAIRAIDGTRASHGASGVASKSSLSAVSTAMMGLPGTVARVEICGAEGVTRIVALARGPSDE
jgi:hypothetical protein